MIHYALLTVDDSDHRSTLTRVIDVDATDGLDPTGRLNSGIDVMLAAARDRSQRIGAIAVTGKSHHESSSPLRLRRDRFGGRVVGTRGVGPRRQVRLVGEKQSVIEALTASGEIERFSSVLIADAGDSGLRTYSVNPADRSSSDVTTSKVLTGTRLDRALAETVARRLGSGGRVDRGVISGCRTAKEDLSTGAAATVAPGDGRGRIEVPAELLTEAARPMVDAAAEFIVEQVRGAEAVVLIGGLGNLPMLQHAVAERLGDTDAVSAGAELIVPDEPESVAATGAALLALNDGAAARGVTFIGGRRQRELLSAVPLSIIGVLLAATMMTAYAISSTLTGNGQSLPAVSMTSVADTASTTTSKQPTSAPTRPTASSPTRVTSGRDQLVVPTALPTEGRDLPDQTAGEPSWATITLPTSIVSTAPTSTITAPSPTVPTSQQNLFQQFPWLTQIPGVPTTLFPPTQTAPTTPVAPQTSPPTKTISGADPQSGNTSTATEPTLPPTVDAPTATTKAP